MEEVSHLNRRRVRLYNLAAQNLAHPINILDLLLIFFTGNHQKVQHAQKATFQLHAPSYSPQELSVYNSTLVAAADQQIALHYSQRNKDSSVKSLRFFHYLQRTFMNIQKPKNQNHILQHNTTVKQFLQAIEHIIVLKYF